MKLLPGKGVGPLAFQKIKAGLVNLVTPRLVVRTATEDLDITTGAKVLVGRRALAALVFLHPMLGHMIGVGRKMADKSLKAELHQTANKKSTTSRSIAQSR
jgi:hypothetical protein